MNVSDLEKQIHFACYNYGNKKERRLIEIKHLDSGIVVQITTKLNEIFIVLKGAFNFASERIKSKQVEQGSMIFFPVTHNFRLETKNEVTAIVLNLDIDINFCSHFSFEKLYREKIDIKEKEKRKEKEFHILNMNSAIENYLNNLVTYLNDGLYCDFFLELKLREFLYILRYYYPIQDLKDFFNPILCEDFMFSDLVRRTYNPKITVSELATRMHYSVSGFEKRFKKVFNISPFAWINMQRAKAIYREINCSTKTFSELGYEFGFSSPSHFNNFCKNIFKETPGNIRRSNHNGALIFEN